MEFDHSTGTLYWACTYLVTGELIQLQKSDLRTVNVATGFSSPVKSMGSNTQIIGFYIPYHASAKGTPAAVTGLRAVADPTGAQSVRLSWTVDGLEIAEPVPGQVVIVVIANDNRTVTRRRVLMK